MNVATRPSSWRRTRRCRGRGASGARRAGRRCRRRCGCPARTCRAGWSPASAGRCGGRCRRRGAGGPSAPSPAEGRGSPSPAAHQPLVPRRGEQVDAVGPDVDRQVPEGLGGVEDERDGHFAADPPDLARRLDDAGDVAGVGHGHEPRVGPDGGADVVGVASVVAGSTSTAVKRRPNCSAIAWTGRRIELWSRRDDAVSGLDGSIRPRRARLRASEQLRVKATWSGDSPLIEPGRFPFGRRRAAARSRRPRRTRPGRRRRRAARRIPHGRRDLRRLGEARRRVVEVQPAGAVGSDVTADSTGRHPPARQDS